MSKIFLTSKRSVICSKILYFQNETFTVVCEIGIYTGCMIISLEFIFSSLKIVELPDTFLIQYSYLYLLPVGIGMMWPFVFYSNFINITKEVTIITFYDQCRQNQCFHFLSGQKTVVVLTPSLEGLGFCVYLWENKNKFLVQEKMTKRTTIENFEISKNIKSYPFLIL